MSCSKGVLNFTCYILFQFEKPKKSSISKKWILKSYNGSITRIDTYSYIGRYYDQLIVDLVLKVCTPSVKDYFERLILMSHIDTFGNLLCHFNYCDFFPGSTFVSNLNVSLTSLFCVVFFIVTFCTM